MRHSYNQQKCKCEWEKAGFRLVIAYFQKCRMDYFILSTLNLHLSVYRMHAHMSMTHVRIMNCKVISMSRNTSQPCLMISTITYFLKQLIITTHLDQLDGNEYQIQHIPQDEITQSLILKQTTTPPLTLKKFSYLWMLIQK